MKYYKLLYDFENSDDYAFCEPQDTYGQNEYSIIDGESIDNWNQNISFIYYPEQGEELLSDYLANTFRWLIISNRFKSLTECLIQNEVQYLPIKIINSADLTENDTYSVINITDIIDALDLNNSIYDEINLEDQKVIVVSKYAFKSNAISGHHIFRLKTETIPVFVSETIRNIIIKNKLTGFDFTEVKVI